MVLKLAVKRRPRIEPPALVPIGGGPATGLAAGGGWQRNAGLLSIATVVISAGNYGFSLVALRLLPPESFSRFAAGQAVLLILGNGAMAAIPWAVARFVATDDRPSTRSEALDFGLRASALQALIAAALAMAVLFIVAGPAIAAVTAAGAAGFSLAAAPVGYLQGTDRVDRLARLRLAEGALRIGASLVVITLLSRDPSLALLGFPIGAAAMLALSLRACRDGFPLRRPDRETARRLLRQSLGLGAVQLLLVMLGASDAVAAQAAGLPTPTVGAYQAASLLGRIPLFISAAVTIAAYTSLSRARDGEEVRHQLGGLLRFYASFAIPVLLACWTVPHSLLAIFAPDSTDLVASLLRYTSLSGAAVGVVNCMTTAHQARRRIRPAASILLPIAVAQPLLLIVLGHTSGVKSFSWALVGISGLAMAAITWDARRWLRWTRPRALAPRAALIAVASCAFWTHNPLLWIVVMLAVTAGAGALLKFGDVTTGESSKSEH